MNNNKDWREPRPMHEDDRLESIARLVPYYRNLWIEADFEGESQELIDGYKRLYEHYSKLLKEGKHYEPKF